MSGYSDKAVNNIQKDAQIWYDSFAKTDAFKVLDEAAQEDA